jgi:hypothetical protein
MTSHDSGRCKTLAVLVLVGPALVFGVIGFAFWDFPGLIPGVVALLVGYLLLRTATSSLVAALDPAPAQSPRLTNIVTGLSADLGLDPPPTFVIKSPGVNALVFRHGGRTALGLTAETVDDLPRTELEAVVAHCLVRSDPASGGLDRTSLTLGGTFGACGKAATELDDARAVAVTRYPPALAKAIERATPATGRFSYLWFVAEGASGTPLEARLDALDSL